jgi:hypothetical protein
MYCGVPPPKVGLSDVIFRVNSLAGGESQQSDQLHDEKSNNSESIDCGLEELELGMMLLDELGMMLLDELGTTLLDELGMMLLDELGTTSDSLDRLLGDSDSDELEGSTGHSAIVTVGFVSQPAIRV